MAVFEGTLENFYTFLGPRTSNIVTEISRSYRNGKSCRQITETGKACGKWRYLDAAHLKGRERKILIKEVLEEHAVKLEDDYYKIGMEQFEQAFRDKHLDFFNVIEFMCRKHHMAYDIKNKIAFNEDDYPVEKTTSENVIDVDFGIETLREISPSKPGLIVEQLQALIANIVKKDVCNQYNLRNSQVTFSRKLDSFWNFDVRKKKFDTDFAFIFYDQANRIYKVALIEPNTISVESFPEKEKETIRFRVDDTFKDKSGFDFKRYLNK